LTISLEYLNPLIREWGNYYSCGNVKKLYQSLDGWIRMRLRSFLNKRKATWYHNQRILSYTFTTEGLESLQKPLPASFPVKGQLQRKAVYRKSIRTV